MNIFWGIVGIILSYLLIRYRGRVYQFTGSWGLAERFLGRGGTATAIVLLGIFIFLTSVTLMTGKMDRILGGTIGRIF